MIPFHCSIWLPPHQGFIHFLLDTTATPQGEEIFQDLVKTFDVAEELFDLELNEKMEYAMTSGKYG